MGEVWGVFRECFGENWPRYNGTALYYEQLSHKFHRSNVHDILRVIQGLILCPKGNDNPGLHCDVIKWKHFPRYWLFMRRNYRSPVDSSHEGKWRGDSMFFFICAWTNVWTNNGDPCDLRRHPTHYDVTVLLLTCDYLHNKPMTSLVATSKSTPWYSSLLLYSFFIL